MQKSIAIYSPRKYQGKRNKKINEKIGLGSNAEIRDKIKEQDGNEAVGDLGVENGRGQTAF